MFIKKITMTMLTLLIVMTVFFEFQYVTTANSTTFPPLKTCAVRSFCLIIHGVFFNSLLILCSFDVQFSVQNSEIICTVE